MLKTCLFIIPNCLLLLIWLQIVKMAADYLNFTLSKFAKHMGLAILWWLWSIVRWVIPRPYRRIDGDVVLITGAGSGLGRELAFEFAKQQCCVVCWDINTEGNEETAEAVREKLDAEIYAMTVDVSDPHKVSAAAKNVNTLLGERYVKILVNNAGILAWEALSNLTDEGIKKSFEVNCLAHFWTVRAFLPRMIEAKDGHIVGVTSTMGQAPSGKCLSPYVASKYAAVGFMEVLSLELLQEGKDFIRTTSVVPGHIKGTKMFDAVNSVGSVSAKYAAQLAVDGIKRGDAEIFVPGWCRVAVWLHKLMPRDTHLSVLDAIELSSATDRMLEERRKLGLVPFSKACQLSKKG